MTLYAGIDLTGRRPDQPPVALFFDRSDVAVDQKSPFVQRVGRRQQSGAVVRLNAVFTSAEDTPDVAAAIRFGDKVARLAVSRDGLWVVESDDASAIPVADAPVLQGVSYAISLTANFGSVPEWKEVVVDGRRVPVQVIDEVEGPRKAEETFVVDVMSGQATESLPSWVADIVRGYTAPELLEAARDQGGRLVCRRTPPPDIEQVSRPAPILTVEGDSQPYFSFIFESSAPVQLQRIWATES